MLTVQDLLNLEQTDHAELFDEVNYPWEVLPLIHEYVEFAMESGTKAQPRANGSFIGPDVIIGEGTVIEPGVVIQGPAIIGRNCEIRSGAYFRENVIVGDECYVGHATELKNSLLFNAVEVPHFNYIGDSVLGYKVHFGAGVITTNTKLPQRPITIATLEKTYNTGLVKLGAIVGDETEVGSNSVLNPGTVIGKRAVIYPLASIRGFVHPDSIVKVRQQQEIVGRRKLE